MEKQNNRVNKITTTHSIYLEFILHYIQNYFLLYCKGHIQMTSNNSNINVETKTNTLNKITTKHSIYLEFILGYNKKMLKIYLKINLARRFNHQCHITTAKFNKVQC